MFRKQSPVAFNLQNAQGFTLLEVVIAMAVFAIGVLGVATMQVSSINTNTSAQERTEAATLSADLIENLMSMPYAALADGGPVNQDQYEINWTVQANVPIANTTTIAVTVDWVDVGTNKQIAFNYVRAQTN